MNEEISCLHDLIVSLIADPVNWSHLFKYETNHTREHGRDLVLSRCCSEGRNNFVFIGPWLT